MIAAAGADPQALRRAGPAADVGERAATTGACRDASARARATLRTGRSDRPSAYDARPSWNSSGVVGLSTILRRTAGIGR